MATDLRAESMYGTGLQLLFARLRLLACGTRTAPQLLATWPERRDEDSALLGSGKARH